MVMYRSASSTFVKIYASNPNCFLMNVSSHRQIFILSVVVDNAAKRLDESRVHSGYTASLLHLRPFNFN
jgi:hypothetical protein